MRLTACLFAAALAVLAAPAFAEGDVAVSMSGRMLTIRGDSASNWISITSGGATDALTISGMTNPFTGVFTTVNGGFVPVTMQHVRSVTAMMGAGDDHVEFDYVKIRGNVTVHLDDGNDQLYFTGTTIRGWTRVRGGAGVDLVRTDATAVFYGTCMIKGDTGNDDLQIVNAQFRNRLRVEGGGDDDHILVQGVTCSSTARFDAVGNGGQDFLEIISCSFGSDVWADMGPDFDKVSLSYSTFAGDVAAFGGASEDDVLTIVPGNVFLRLQHYDEFEEGQPN